ncbi:fucolectin-6-like [Mixophyes fleayi]|uniref:fucolectin-6-like n=1 Tax=Mixophyes fleayi TaxID=3061075 RepID=UPI003F4DC3BE
MDQLVAVALLGFLGLAQSCNPEADATNIAINGEASQITTYLTNWANKSIDGNIDSDYFHYSCSHTNSSYNAWWQLDLKQSYKIAKVVVTGRSDNYKGRLLNVDILIGDLPNRKNPLCGTVTNISSITVPFCCNGMIGQYVNVVATNRYEQLTLCEVEVYRAVEKPCS